RSMSSTRASPRLVFAGRGRRSTPSGVSATRPCWIPTGTRSICSPIKTSNPERGHGLTLAKDGEPRGRGLEPRAIADQRADRLEQLLGGAREAPVAAMREADRARQRGPGDADRV